MVKFNVILIYIMVFSYTFLSSRSLPVRTFNNIDSSGANQIFDKKI